ncbi:MAG TPA: arylesterase [Vicinamibacterales bacterium]|nr:arylesterase [Vicinamibacterales bacterium]
MGDNDRTGLMHALSHRRVAAALPLVLALAACAGERPAREDGPNPPPQPAATVRPRPRIVVLGDSLTAGLGLPPAEAYPAHLQRRLDEAGLRYEVINAGVSGETSSGGLRRLDWVLDGDVRVLIVALGGNDGLRGVPVDELRRNLEAIVRRARARGVTVVLAGMEAPPNHGPEYTAAFRQVYRDLARRYRLPLVPFLLAGVAGDPAFNQADGIHPNAAGAARVADNVWRVLRPVLEAATDD